ncbi:MAG TPA: hypothetical protein VEA15_04705 [Caulobacteraceae bacterium]|nr:hypothetical protein [Caulobacteraceae bacterium]
MAYVDLEIPPGVFANGTARQARGRWRLSNLVRWPNGPDLQPVGGWRPRSEQTVAGAARAILTWRDNANQRWIGIGTHTGLYVMTPSGAVHDITPVGFTAGQEDAFTGGGYGEGVYGAGAYGTRRPDSATITPASVWTLDTWGQYLVACSEQDGRLYLWTLDTAQKAQPIAGAPEGCNGLVVTAENFILGLRDRNVAWCDQADEAVWTPDPTNQAGDLDLQTPGTLMCGRRVRGATLVFSDVDVWQAQYLGGVAVYGFQRVGADCGLIAKGAAVSLDTRAVWMGKGAFFVFNGGAVDDLPCEVADHVFGDLNEQQASKVSAWHNTEHGEIWWHYPSANSAENDRYVAWSYRTDKWAVGELARTCGAPAGVFQRPILIDAAGVAWEHETDWNWGGAIPYARSAPVELAPGDRVVKVSGFVGDEKSLGESAVRFFVRAFPNLPESEHGPYPVSGAPVDVRFTARQVETQVEFAASADSRVGVLRLDLKPGGRR